jgi:hypothetical protein
MNADMFEVYVVDAENNTFRGLPFVFTEKDTFVLLDPKTWKRSDEVFAIADIGSVKIVADSGTMAIEMKGAKTELQKLRDGYTQAVFNELWENPGRQQRYMVVAIRYHQAHGRDKAIADLADVLKSNIYPENDFIDEYTKAIAELPTVCLNEVVDWYRLAERILDAALDSDLVVKKEEKPKPDPSTILVRVRNDRGFR